MPDYRHSTPLQVSAADSQAELLRIAEQLQGPYERLGRLAEAIASEPKSALTAVLRGAAACVSSDLLSDAIETLQTAGRQTEEGARREQASLIELITRIDAVR